MKDEDENSFRVSRLLIAPSEEEYGTPASLRLSTWAVLFVERICQSMGRVPSPSRTRLGRL